VAVTITIDGSDLSLPEAAAIRLAHEFRAYSDGDRGERGDPWPAETLAAAIEQRLTDPSRGPILISESDDLDALHRALNAIVEDVGPPMQLFVAVDMARRAS
jgi:hypothetical protein